MSGRMAEATTHGLGLIAAGTPLRVAAALAGVSASTLVRARKRAGLPPLTKGRPGKRVAE